MTQILDKFKNLEGTISILRADLEPKDVDFVINIRPEFKKGDLLMARTSSGCEFGRLTVASRATMRETGMSSYQIQWFQKHAPSVACPPFAVGHPALYRGFVRTRTWTVSTIFAAYPMVAFFRGPLRRWRRRRRGLCIRCGYNLEGNVSGVCSECGEAT